MTSGGMKLKAGEVVRIRVNPKDCLSVLDVLEAANINTRAMSFSQCVSLALGSLLETARHSKLIDEPDGFDFLNRMRPFKTAVSASHKKKLEITGAMQELGSRIHAPAIGDDMAHETAVLEPEVITAEQRRARSLLTELNAKKELAESGNPNVTWMSDDQQEFERLCKIVYG